ncbi:hypothetical protein ACH475_14085 [Streptomyces globisporus]|uniref:hypothetical protein n=1 Tax=Streptomyces globisporus TaxID=1908 RepID=UPI0037BB7247|nr:hypothetical protein OG449_34340 [Streptomyces globisporus]
MVKLTVFQFEGTAEELDASQALRELTQPRHGMTTVVRTQGPATAKSPAGTLHVPGVADEGQDVVRALLRRSPAADLFVRFLREATGWDNVAVHGIKRKGAQPGDPLDYSDYLRLRRQGSQMGGFAYVYAEHSVVNLRLSCSRHELDEMGATLARTRDTGHQSYRVSVDLKDEASLEQALQLARTAYDQT